MRKIIKKPAKFSCVLYEGLARVTKINYALFYEYIGDMFSKWNQATVHTYLIFFSKLDF